MIQSFYFILIIYLDFILLFTLNFIFINLINLSLLTKLIYFTLMLKFMLQKLHYPFSKCYY